MSKIIEVNDLYKYYDNVKAVNGINFTVEEGSFFSFLGQNGAGKSTTINIISTLLQHTKGNVLVNGYEVGKEDDKIRDIIGIVFQDSVLDDLLTVKENLELRASFYNMEKEEIIKRIDEVSSIVSIKDILKRKYETLSGGQRRRVDIARALLNKPRILILDEPTTGLDPHARKQVWETIIELNKENNITIFLTTHYMEETKNSDYVVIIDQGNIIACGTPEELRLKYSKDKLMLIPKNVDNLKSLLDKQNLKYIHKVDIFEVELKDSLESINIINSVKDEIVGLEVIRGNMDDVFVNITGRELECR